MLIAGVKTLENTRDCMASATALVREPKCLPDPLSRARLHRMWARDSCEKRAGATPDWMVGTVL